MYSIADLITFATDEFARGLEGLTPDEAGRRMPKADGTSMNAIAWNVQHIAAHWHNAALTLAGRPFESRYPSSDGTPPPYLEALTLLQQFAAEFRSVPIDPERMTQPVREGRPELVSQFVARAIFHTWFHAGEVNAVRQLLGHPEIPFVGDLKGRFATSPSAD